jgi:hypothetical protein
MLPGLEIRGYRSAKCLPSQTSETAWAAGLVSRSLVSRRDILHFYSPGLPDRGNAPLSLLRSNFPVLSPCDKVHSARRNALRRHLALKWDLYGVLTLLASTAAYGAFALAHVA